jgi:hypothetical protein
VRCPSRAPPGDILNATDIIADDSARSTNLTGWDSYRNSVAHPQGESRPTDKHLKNRVHLQLNRSSSDCPSGTSTRRETRNRQAFTAHNLR